LLATRHAFLAAACVYDVVWNTALSAALGCARLVTLTSLQCDLVDNREVSSDEGRVLAKILGLPFFESSAKSRINVEEAFHQLVRVSVFDSNHASTFTKSCVHIY
jgi:hypothetical protein